MSDKKLSAKALKESAPLLDKIKWRIAQNLKGYVQWRDGNYPASALEYWSKAQGLLEVLENATVFNIGCGATGMETGLVARAKSFGIEIPEGLS